MFSALRNSIHVSRINLRPQFISTTLKHLKTSTPKNASLAVPANGARNKTIGVWLAGCSGMVAGAVVLGGVTRYPKPPKNDKKVYLILLLYVC